MTKSKYPYVLPAGTVVKVLGFHKEDAYAKASEDIKARLIGKTFTLKYGMIKTRNNAIRGPYYCDDTAQESFGAIVDTHGYVCYFYAVKLKIISIPDLLSTDNSQEHK